MLGANIGQDVGRTIFVKDFYFNAVSLDIYLLYQTYQSSKWWMCLWWSQSNLSFCSHQIYICFGWSIMGDYYWVCLPGKTWLLWSNEKNLLPNPLWGMWHFSDPSLRWASRSSRVIPNIRGKKCCQSHAIQSYPCYNSLKFFCFLLKLKGHIFLQIPL